MKTIRFFTPILFYLLIFIPGIASSTESTIIMPPKFVPALNTDGAVKYIDEKSLEEMFRVYSPKLKDVVYNHSIKKFIIPDTNWVHDLFDMYEEYIRSSHMRPQQDTWDCENYATLLNSFASIRLWRAGYLDTRLALGWMRIQGKYPWAGIPDAIHALIFAITSEGILVIEPQNGQFTMLKSYPNRAYIEEVYLF